MIEAHYGCYNWGEQGRRLQQILAGVPGDLDSLQDLRYSYDSVGNLLSIQDYTNGAPQTQSFTYDALYRLTGAKAENGDSGNYDQSLASSLGYTYNPANGNLASKAGTLYTYGDMNHKHAVTALSNGNTYSYDQNGNMTQRVVGGQTYNLGYDAENRMVSVSGAAAAAYTYTGDGQRIVATEGVTTTVYLGNYLEWAKNGETITTKSYYYAGTTRVAMRQDGGAPLWLFGDHLGSTNVVANYDGSAHGKQGYQAWGETRFVSGDIPTNFQYTGQRNEASIGLHYYGARWYDSSLGRFAQADTIIPEDAQGVQAWDRYAGMNNNAVNYADPSGHSQVLGECTFKNCAPPKLLWTWDNLAALYGITFGGKGKWTEEAKAAVVLAANRIGRAFLKILFDLLGEETGSTRDAFVKVFGKITIILTDSDRNGCDAGYQVITCGGATVIDSQLIAHELGHVFAYRYDNKPYNKLREAKIMDRGGHLVAGDSGSGYLRTTSGFKGNVPPYMYHGPIDFKEDWNVGSIAWHEDWADMFMNWAFDSFDLTLEANGAGWSRYWWMMTNMAEFIQ